MQKSEIFYSFRFAVSTSVYIYNILKKKALKQTCLHPLQLATIANATSFVKKSGEGYDSLLSVKAARFAVSFVSIVNMLSDIANGTMPYLTDLCLTYLTSSYLNLLHSFIHHEDLYTLYTAPSRYLLRNANDPAPARGQS